MPKPPKDAIHNIAPPLLPMAMPVDKLTNWEDNPNRGDVEKIKTSLTEFTQMVQIIYVPIDGTLEVQAGNHRLIAAVEMGWTHIAAMDGSHLTAAQMKAYRIMDNMAARAGTHDEDLLRDAIADALEVDEIPIDHFGMSEKEWDKLTGNEEDEDTDPQLGDFEYRIQIDCDSEDHQAELLARLAAADIEGRAIIL